MRLDLGDGDSAPTFEESTGRHAWPGKGCRVFAFLITLWPRALFISIRTIFALGFILKIRTRFIATKISLVFSFITKLYYLSHS